MTSAVCTDQAKGKLRIVGNIDVKEPDGSDGGHFPLAILVTFDSVEEVRKALLDGKCTYEFTP
jgi:hypothetical protein